MKVLVASQADGGGGAARAAYRIHRALIGSGVTSRMLVDRRTTDDPTVITAGSRWRSVRTASRQLRILTERGLLKLQQPDDVDYRTVGMVPGPSGGVLRSTTADVVNVHWTGAGYLSIPQFARVTKPMVWTLHDMWAFCGAEHYAPDGPDTRFREGYRPSNRPLGAARLDVDRAVWRFKRLAWQRPVHLVAPSQWMARCAAASASLSNWPCTVIPYALQLDVFRPHPKSIAREVFGLPSDPNVPLIAFGAPGGTKDPRKGWDLLAPALRLISNRLPTAQAVVFGQSAPVSPPRVGMPLHFVGRLSDDVSLALLYGAADVMVVPSRQDNLPQTAVEAQSCGTPVVAFRTGGLADTLEDRVTGYLADAFDVADLATGIAWALDGPSSLSQRARERALALWSPAIIAEQYQNLFAGLATEE